MIIFIISGQNMVLNQSLGKCMSLFSMNELINCLQQAEMKMKIFYLFETDAHHILTFRAHAFSFQ